MAKKSKLEINQAYAKMRLRQAERLPLGREREGKLPLAQERLANVGLYGSPSKPKEKLFTPTVLSDTNIRQNVIPDLQSRASNLYGLPSPYQPPPTGDKVTTTGAPKTPADTELSSLLGTDTELKDDPLQKEHDQLQEDVFKMQEQAVSDQAKRQAQSVATAYSQRKRDLAILQEQAGAQKAGLAGSLFSSGASRYGSVSGGGLVTSTERGLMNQLSDLNFDEREAIDKVREAQKDGDYRVMQARLDYADKVRAQKEKRQDELNKEIRTRNKETTKRRLEIERGLAVADAIGGLGSNVEKGTLLASLNEEGIEMTADELDKIVKNLSGDKKKTFEGFSADIQDYYNFAENYPEALPDSIKNLPENQRPLAYVKYISSLTRVPEKPKAGDTFKLTSAGRSKLIGANIPLNQINAIEEYLTLYGFDEQLQQSLGDSAGILASILSGEDNSGEDNSDDPYGN